MFGASELLSSQIPARVKCMQVEPFAADPQRKTERNHSRYIMNSTDNFVLDTKTAPRPTTESSREGVHKYQNTHFMICLALALLSVLENIILCFVHLPRQTSERIQNAMFVNHCITNILQAACVVLLSLQLFPGHPDLIEFLVGLFYYSSVLSVPVICVWRFVKTFHAHYLQVCDVFTWAVLSLVPVWLLAFCVTLPPFLGWGAFPMTLTIPATSTLPHAIFSLVALALPSLVMCICDYKIFVRIKSFRFKSRSRDAFCLDEAQESTVKWMLFYQVLALAVLCLPAAVELIVVSCIPAERIPPLVHPIVSSLALFHSLLAPALHAVSSKHTWRKFGSRFARKDQVALRSAKKRGHRQWHQNPGQHVNAKEATINEHSGQDGDERTADFVKGIGASTLENKVRFQNVHEMSDKQYRKYISTPSPKRMRSIQRALQSIDLTTSIASISSNDHCKQYKIFRHNNGRDAHRSTAFCQMNAEKTRLQKRSSFPVLKAERGAAKRFLEQRNSTEGDYAMQRLCQWKTPVATGKVPGSRSSSSPPL